MDYNVVLDELFKFLGKNWEWIIAVLSLVGAAMANLWNTKNYKKETQARLEVEFYDFLIEVNSLNDINKKLENEIGKDIYDGKEAMYRSVLETKLLDYTGHLATLVGKKVDYSGNFSPTSKKENIKRIKVPLKNMKAISSIAYKVEQLNILRNDADEFEGAELKIKDFEEELVEIKRLIENELSEYFY